MMVHESLTGWDLPPGVGTAATLGNYDGVHLGHQVILSRVRERAADLNLQSIILTFNPIPKKVLSPETAPPLIQTLEQRLHSLASLGMDHAIVIPFTREFAAQSPQEFVQHFLVER